MDINAIVGIILLALAYGFLVYLILRSRRTIDMIAQKKLTSAVEILEELRHGK